MLADYPEDAPAADPEDMTGMVCPVSFAAARGGEETLADRVRREVAGSTLVRAGRERRGRTTFGSAGLDIDGM